jgi:hypothetical protein
LLTGGDDLENVRLSKYSVILPEHKNIKLFSDTKEFYENICSKRALLPYMLAKSEQKIGRERAEIK